jgi:hypothetical protein
MGFLWHKEIMTRKVQIEKKSFDKTPEELYIYIIEVEINFIFVVGIKLSVNVLKLSTLALKSITDNIKQNTNET